MTTDKQDLGMHRQRLPIVGKKLFPLEHYRDDSHYPHGKAERLLWRDNRTGLSRELFWEVPRAIDFTLPELAGDELETT